MGRIDRSGGQDAVMERRHIQQMVRNVEEYEEVKRKKHRKYRYAKDFYEDKEICKQNFHKYYKRYVASGRDINELIPHKSGRKFKDMMSYETVLREHICACRKKGYNRYEIVSLLKKNEGIEISASHCYRLMCKLKVNRLNPKMKQEIRRIVKMEAGELGHIDIHYISQGTVKGYGNKLYILGVIDAYSRVCWLEVIESIKALDVSFSMLNILTLLRGRYGIEFKEMLSDNGREFSSRNNTENHPTERMLEFLEIKHRYTKPFTPKTNGKIERFWRTLEEELLDGETFESLDDLKHHVKGYCLYYNEHRMHQGINLDKPVDKIDPQLLNL